MLRAEDRAYLGQFDLADAGEVIDDLLLFVLELFGIGQDLPLASAAHPEMLASRLTADFARFYDAQHFRLHEGVLLLGDLQIDDIARHAVRHKGDDVVDAHQGFAFGGHTGDLYVLVYR